MGPRRAVSPPPPGVCLALLDEFAWPCSMRFRSDTDYLPWLVKLMTAEQAQPPGAGLFFLFGLRVVQVLLQEFGQSDEAARHRGGAIAEHEGNAAVHGRDDGLLIQRDDRRHRVLHRSEEHTSELQSRPHLVCRLLLE